eukprot:281680-Pelagomonas_calceolata.AAC.1
MLDELDHTWDCLYYSYPGSVLKTRDRSTKALCFSSSQVQVCGPFLTFQTVKRKKNYIDRGNSPYINQTILTEDPFPTVCRMLCIHDQWRRELKHKAY